MHRIDEGFAAVNGAALFYRAQGQGPPLLLIHAGVTDHGMWVYQWPALAEQFRVIAVDLRGFGRSAMPPGPFSNVEDVRGVLDHFQLKSAFILGISFGGLIALDFALAYPDRCRALVLGAPSVSGARPSARIREFWAAEEAALEAGDLARATELNLALWVDGPQRGPGEVDAAVRERVRAMQQAIFEMEIPDDIEEVAPETPAVEQLGAVSMPVLLLVGALDLPEKLALVDDLAATIPRAEKTVLPDVAHMLNMERPAQFNRRVLAFLTAHDR